MTLDTPNLRAGIGADAEDRLRRRARWFLALALLPLIGHAFIPFEEFIHRGDDAYYYFKVAINYPKYGRWTFDGIHWSNGFQPLWGALLCAIAQVCAWFGLTDPDVMARLFTAFTALMHFAGGMLLFELLSRHVSVPAAVAAAGGLLFPLGIVWTHVWGMENSLSSVLILGSLIFYHHVFLKNGTARNAALLGLMLGIAVLCRLNTGFLLPSLALFYLFGRQHDSFARRVRLTTVLTVVSSAIIVPYLLWNVYDTGHALPVAGGAKVIRTEQFLAKAGVESVFSWEFVERVYSWAGARLGWFLRSRIVDGMWIGGGRMAFLADVRLVTLWKLTAFVVLVPFLSPRPLEWPRLLWRRLRKLGTFGYFALFALLNFSVCITSYPYEATYSMVRWWLLESEILLIAIFATVVGTALEHLVVQWIPARRQLLVVSAWLLLITTFSMRRMYRFYWDGVVQFPDWNLSTNDTRYEAGQWIQENLPPDAVVGCWNAGVLAYYIDAHVVNLDGLINDWEFLTYLDEGNLSDYVKAEGIEYLADTEYELESRAGREPMRHLELSPVYRRHMDPGRTGVGYRDQFFWVYRVDGMKENRPAPRAIRQSKASR